MANYTKFLEAQERHAKKSHPKCRRRGTSPRIPKAVRPKRKSTAAKYDADDGLLRSVTAKVVVSKTWDSKPRKQGVFGLSEGNFLNSLNVSEADNPLERPKTQFELRIAVRDHALVGW